MRVHDTRYFIIAAPRNEVKRREHDKHEWKQAHAEVIYLGLVKRPHEVWHEQDLE